MADLRSPNYSSIQFWWILALSAGIGVFGLLLFYVLDHFFLKPSGQPRKKKGPPLPPDAQPDKSVLKCDATNCDKTNPTHKCGQCKLVYYCGKECQTKHWKEGHKKDCQLTSANVFSNPFVPLKKDQVDWEATPKEDVPCSICLATEINRPIVWKDCHHVFCYKCIVQYDEYQESLQLPGENGPAMPSTYGKCPYCPTAQTPTMIDEHRDTILAKALLYATRVRTPGISAEKKLEACQQAMRVMNILMEAPQNQADTLQTNILTGHLAVSNGDYPLALKAFQENEVALKEWTDRKHKVDELLSQGKMLGTANKKKGKKATTVNDNADDDDSDDDDDDEGVDEETYQKMQQIQNDIMETMAQGGMASDADWVRGRLQTITVKMEMKEWKTATTMYDDLQKDYAKQMTLSQQRQVWLGMARCHYELGNYNDSIGWGEASLRMRWTRHLPASHKYLALAYMAKGHWKHATSAMARAYFYEAPWDGEHRATVRDLWADMMQEEGDA